MSSSSYTIAFILIAITLANLLWAFLLPAKGESLPIVKMLTELERTIKRADDTDAGNWSTLRKQIQKQRMELSLLQKNYEFTEEQKNTLNRIYEALYLLVQGNWLLYEISDDPEKIKNCYSKALLDIQVISDHQLKFTIQTGSQESDRRIIDLNNSVAQLYNLINDQIQYLEENYNI